MRRLVTVALTAAVVLLGAAPASAAGLRTGVKDPCDLLTRREIGRAFGQQAGRPTQILGPGFCQWVLSETSTRAPGQVNTLLERGKKATRDYRLGEELAGALLEPVDGLGKKAFFTPGTGTLFVLAPGPTLFYVQANVYDPDAQRIADGLKDALVTLATRAETRV